MNYAKSTPKYNLSSYTELILVTTATTGGGAQKREFLAYF